MNKKLTVSWVADGPLPVWMGRGLAALGLAPGEEVTGARLRNLFGEWSRHPYVDRIEIGVSITCLSGGHPEAVSSATPRSEVRNA